MKLYSTLALAGALATAITLSASALGARGTDTKSHTILSSLLDDEADEADEPRELDLRDVAPSAKISLTKAITLSLAAQAGKAVEAGIEGEVHADGVAIFYEVMIVGTDGKLHEIKLSPTDGKVIENGIESSPEELMELRGFQQALRHSELSLIQLIGSAKGLVKGKPVSASLEIDDEGPECEVLLVNGRYLVGVDVEARAGHIVEVELGGASADDDEHGSRDEEREGEADDHDGHRSHRAHRRGDDEDDDDDHGADDEDDDR